MCPRYLSSIVAVLGMASSGYADDLVHAASPATFSLQAANLDDPALVDILFTLNLWDVVHDADGQRLFVSEPTTGTIHKVDISGSSPTITVYFQSQGAVFHGLDWNPAGQFLYALDSASDTLITINDAGQTTPPTPLASGFQRPNDVCHDPVTGNIYVTDSGHDVFRIYTKNGTLLRTVSTPETVGIWGVAVPPGGGNPVVSSHDLGSVYQYDGNGGFSTLATNLNGPRGLAFDRSGTLYVAQSGHGMVSRINADGSTTDMLDGSPQLRALSLHNEKDGDGDFIGDWWERDLFGGLHAVGREAMARYAFSPSGQPARIAVSPNGNTIDLGHRLVQDSSLRTSYQISGNLTTWFDITPTAVSALLAEPHYIKKSAAFDLGSVGMQNADSVFFRLIAAPAP